MKVLVTGHHGYIGSVLTGILIQAGHSVVGMDSFYYRGCTYGQESGAVEQIEIDVRDITPDLLAGYDAIIHLAALSNDPLGDLNPEWTFDINYHATIHLAKAVIQAKVRRFLFSSSCSIYGGGTDGLAGEEASLSPLSNYAISKARTEEGLLKLASDRFSPVILRNSTFYGISPRLRLDLVLNNLVAWAHTTGQITILSDGLAWRPLIHVQDASQVMLAILEAPLETVHSQVFNVGMNSENYQVLDLAQLIVKAIPGCEVNITGRNNPDPRNYRVDFSKLHNTFPHLTFHWNARDGVEELYHSYQQVGLTKADFQGPKYTRINWLGKLLAEDKFDHSLRWKVRHNISAHESG
jgi:nucleoside-diphosphate-sugar epimerase